MATLVHCEVDLGRGLTIEKVETLLRRYPVDETPRAMELDLSECQLLPPGPAWRLGNAMSRWAETGQVTVIVPEPGDFSGSWFLQITRSGFGLAMARFASEIRLADGTEISERVRGYYEGPGLRSSASNYATAVDLPETNLIESLDAFADDLKPMARTVGIEEGSLTQDSKKALHQMCFEAIENVLDHAFRSPYESRCEQLSYMSLGFYKGVDANRAAGEEFRDYLTEVAAGLPADRDHLGFVEVVIADTGCGIAARQSQDTEIYAGPLKTELKFMRDALALGGTIKLEVGDSFIRGEPGLGSGYILEGLRDLRAFGILRTGRCLLTLDATASDEKASWHAADEPLGYLPGTALHIVFPLLSAQLHMPRQ